jgi:hypothetical protein
MEQTIWLKREDFKGLPNHLTVDKDVKEKTKRTNPQNSMG